MGSLFNGKCSQWSNRFLPVTKAYLKPIRKSAMELFLLLFFTFNYFRKSLHRRCSTGLNTPLSYLFAKVHKILTSRSTKFFFCETQWWFFSVLIPCYTTTIDPQSKACPLQIDKLNNRANKSSNWVGFK